MAVPGKNRTKPVSGNAQITMRSYICFPAGLLAAAFSLPAACNSMAISVSNTGIATITFDVLPAVTDFSSRTWSGGATDFTTAAALDAAVQTNSASLFNVALNSAAANP